MYTNSFFDNKRFFHIIIRNLSSGGYFLLFIAMIISYSGCKGGSSSDGDPVLAGDGKNIPITPMESEPQTPAEQPQSDPLATPNPTTNTSTAPNTKATNTPATVSTPNPNQNSGKKGATTYYPPATSTQSNKPAAIVAENTPAPVYTPPATNKSTPVYTPPAKTDPDPTPVQPVAIETPKSTKAPPAAPTINSNKIKVDLQRKLIDLSRKPRDSRLMSDIRGYFASTKQAGVISTDKRQYSVEQYLVTINMSGEMDIHITDIDVDNTGKITRISIEQTELK